MDGKAWRTAEKIEPKATTEGKKEGGRDRKGESKDEGWLRRDVYLEEENVTDTNWRSEGGKEEGTKGKKLVQKKKKDEKKKRSEKKASQKVTMRDGRAGRGSIR
ncbi:hypothetical protein E2C01_046838 [Portunus trituberculatus]|uniref:Uncharacterized protein n=1 Tax=Portunus trituberculatus TaxID=210409 RepID=A0A5B7G658_PORTR|nr:hypothetical protein [Portunus trituberculatus]